IYLSVLSLIKLFTNLIGNQFLLTLFCLTIVLITSELSVSAIFSTSSKVQTLARFQFLQFFHDFLYHLNTFHDFLHSRSISLQVGVYEPPHHPQPEEGGFVHSVQV
ncbi:MAG: hypothetical protein U9Q66_03685, partial [Patescibacteria group bacterium]|nr:hypothetical protein [Patescibacteria group bacterium]